MHQSSVVSNSQSPDTNDNRAVNTSRRLTVTMTVIVIVYLVCQLPSAIVKTVWVIDTYIYSLFHGFQLRALLFHLVTVTGACLIVINSLVDCVTYVLMGKRFRQILINALFCRRDSGRKLVGQ